MKSARYRAEDLLEFGKRVMVRLGFPEEQAHSASWVLVEADMRGDFPHGLAGNIGLHDFIDKVSDNKTLGFERLKIIDYVIEQSRYPAIIPVDARGGLGHHVGLELVPIVAERAKKYGYAKAFIRNSTHFGDCGIYSELIAEHGLAARVSCTAPAWSKPFVELQDKQNPEAPVNRERYKGVKKRLGTNPVAWTIPYGGGMITMDMAATQRAVSPALAVAKHNSVVAGVTVENGGHFIMLAGEKKNLAEIHLEIASSATRQEALAKLGLPEETGLLSVERGLFLGPGGEEINYPLALDSVLKNECHIAPLGGAFFGYKGFGLNLLIELDNVLGGGVPGLIRELSPQGLPLTPEWVSQTIEAYAIDGVYPLEEALARLKHSVEVTLEHGNKLVLLPGQKEQDHKKECLQKGVPLTQDLVTVLKRAAARPEVDIPFDLEPITG